MTDEECPWCAGPAAKPGEPAGPPPAFPGTCALCRRLLAATRMGYATRLNGSPVAVAAPCTDLGALHGVRLILLAVELWPEHSALRIAYEGDTWIDTEVRALRGRWTVTDGRGRAEAGFTCSFGGNEWLGEATVMLPTLPPDAGPWTVTLERGDRVSSTVVGIEEMVRTRPWSATSSAPPHPDDRARCNWCTTTLAEEQGGCARCRGIVEELLASQEALRPHQPVGMAFARDLGEVGWGEVSVLALERWGGWWTLRVHLAPQEGFLDSDWSWVGAWQAVDDRERTADGWGNRGGAGDEGTTMEVTFPGTIDPEAEVLSITHSAFDEVILGFELTLNDQ